MIRVDVGQLDRLVADLEAGVDDLAVRLERVLADDRNRARIRAWVASGIPIATGRLR